MMRSFLYTFLAVLTIGGLVACGGHEEQGTHGHGHDAAPREVVSWPVIRDLDNLAHLGEVAADTSDTDLMVATAEKIVAAAEVLWTDGVPQGARNREEVAALVDDLRSIIGAMAQGLENENPEALADPLRASHTIISRIMETAGMPHHHDHHDHEHHDHDHDHDHDHEH
ncbi:MAG: hypothetical protein JJU11_07685 [Candidatus Sumerlaeia bacterium]|nr:hypothetical protein [Candidatus Sumerlaeia bacterium]